VAASLAGACGLVAPGSALRSRLALPGGAPGGQRPPTSPPAARAQPSRPGCHPWHRRVSFCSPSMARGGSLFIPPKTKPGNPSVPGHSTSSATTSAAHPPHGKPASLFAPTTPQRRPAAPQTRRDGAFPWPDRETITTLYARPALTHWPTKRTLRITVAEGCDRGSPEQSAARCTGEATRASVTPLVTPGSRSPLTSRLPGLFIAALSGANAPYSFHSTGSHHAIRFTR
jgi:hypothetical protein